MMRYPYIRSFLFGIFIATAQIGVFSLMGLSATWAFSMFVGVAAVAFMLSLHAIETTLRNSLHRPKPVPPPNITPPQRVPPNRIDHHPHQRDLPKNCSTLTVSFDPRDNVFQSGRRRKPPK
jgi:hypothetical protein